MEIQIVKFYGNLDFKKINWMEINQNSKNDIKYLEKILYMRIL